MLAEDRLREGDLEGALLQLQERVRKEPANAALRVFLFQLLALMGQWPRALNQLGVAGELDAGTLAMVQTYREALRCEVLRAEVFAGKRSPLIFGQPAEWVALLLEARRLLAQGAAEQAREVAARALAAAPATAGSIDGVDFDWIMDGDGRLGPILEAIVNGRYYWIPLQRIAAIRFEQPADLRDLVWMPAYFTWANGGEGVGLVPTRYPASESSQDPRIRMARKTDWLEVAPGLHIGQGQRMLVTDGGDHPLMDVRHIALSVPDGQDPDADRSGTARG